MNLFEVMILNVVLITFPLIIYNLFLSTNKNISNSCKKMFFSFALLSSFYLTYKYSTDNIVVNIFITSSLVLIAYLKRQVIVANVLSIIIILTYVNSLNNMIFMILPYIILLFMYLLKKKINITDFFFIDIFIFIQYIFFIIWIKIFNLNYIDNIGIIELTIMMLLNYVLVHIIYLLYDQGESIIKYHSDYKELKQEKQIRLSLFKITHEIKNPIAVIKAYLDMLDVTNTKQVKKYIPIIKNEIDRLLNLLQDFMLVNKDNIECDIMDINLLLEEVIDSLHPLLKENNIILNKDLIDDDIYINGDYKRLSQVIINLIKNSIEAIDKEKGVIKVKNSINNNILNIIIEDNGSGISMKNLDKIKQPFYTTKSRGTGLGVSLSDEIIKAHNGNLIYSSKEKKGTKVTIQLPLDGKEREF